MMVLRRPVLDTRDDNFDTCLHKKHALPGPRFIPSFEEHIRRRSMQQVMFGFAKINLWLLMSH